MKIRSYNNETDRKAIINLMQSVFTIDSFHNDPATSIDRKLKQNDNLFFVAESDNKKIIGMVIVGYDGHRGWIYSLGVDPLYQKKGVGSTLLKYSEKQLLNLNCPKINLQVLPANKEVIDFYKKNGFNLEERISMGKKLY